MQVILSIDAASEPAQALLVGIEGKEIQVLEQHSLLWPRSNIAASEAGESLPSEVAQAEGVAATNGHSTNQRLEISTRLREILSSIKTPYTSSIIVANFPENVSLNLDLPFAEKKSIEKVIDLEVQDLAPFEITEFLVQHQYLNPLTEGGHDIHVGLVPKSELKELLDLCRDSGVEPMAVSTPASVLSAAYYLSREPLEADSAILKFDNDQANLLITFDGKPRLDKSIALDRTDETSLKAALSEIRRCLAHAESRYKKKLTKIYLIGTPESSIELSKTLNHPVESLSLAEILPNTSDQSTVAALAAVFATDEAPPPLLTNYRTREFSYRPQLAELVKALRRLKWYIGALLLTALMGVSSVYIERQNEIYNTRETIRAAIQKVANDDKQISGDEMQFLRTKVGQLREQLLGIEAMPTEWTPLDTYVQLISDFPSDVGATVTEINITGEKYLIQAFGVGSGPGEKVEDAFNKRKRKKDLYCEVRVLSLASSPGPGGTKGFKVELAPCRR